MSSTIPEADQAPSSGSTARTVAGLRGVPGQGPHMLIVLRLAGGRITQAQFSTYGCPAAAACGQFVTEQVEGKNWRDVEQESICEETIVAGVGRMPLGREHCPGLAAGALRHALDQLRASFSGEASAPESTA